MKKITADRLREVIHYNHATGEFTWLVALSNRAPTGSRAGSIKHKKNGPYRCIRIDGRDYDEGVLAFLYMTSLYPTKRIDHHDTNGTNNAWINLREAEVWENRANSTKPSRGQLGIRGVRYIPGRRKPYHARLIWASKLYSLGYYTTPEMAKQAHDAKARELWEKFGRFEPLPAPPPPQEPEQGRS